MYTCCSLGICEMVPVQVLYKESPRNVSVLDQAERQALLPLGIQSIPVSKQYIYELYSILQDVFMYVSMYTDTHTHIHTHIHTHTHTQIHTQIHVSNTFMTTCRYDVISLTSSYSQTRQKNSVSMWLIQNTLSNEESIYTNKVLS